MSLKNKLLIKPTVSVAITPQLQQILKFLQLNNLDFVEELKKTLEDNPLVELEEQEMEEDTEIYQYYNFYPHQSFGGSDSTYWNVDNFSQSKTLEESLEEQISFFRLDSKTREVLTWIVWNLDDNGFFTGSAEEICAKFNISEDEFESIRLLAKNLEPCGVGAKDFIECLLWQLEARGFARSSLPALLLTDYFDAVLKGRFELIEKKLNVSSTDIKNALKIIRSLNPKPANQYKDSIQPGLPVDLILEIRDQKFIVSLNKHYIPRIKIKSQFDQGCDPAFAKVIKNLTNAVKAIKKVKDQRESSLVRVAQQIVDEQKEFFQSQGLAPLKPLTLKQVAEKLGLHESTVSRATANKFLATPFGVFELKKFFSSKVNSDEISSEYLKRLVQEVILEEDKLNPLSDLEIANVIQERFGIKIARRTVAKYREALKIAPAHQRKYFHQINL